MRFWWNIALLIISMVSLQEVSVAIPASEPMVGQRETVRAESAKELIRQVRQHTAATPPYSFEHLVLQISSQARTATSQHSSRHHHTWHTAYAVQTHEHAHLIHGGHHRPQTVTAGMAACTPSRLCRWII